jgi:hypothetical protein
MAEQRQDVFCMVVMELRTDLAELCWCLVEALMAKTLRDVG